MNPADLRHPQQPRLTTIPNLIFTGCISGAGRDVGGLSPPAACRELAALALRTPEAKQHFLGEGGVLVLLELLDSQDSKVGSVYSGC